MLTVSVHESGAYLYPGSGRVVETGSGPGLGFAVNVPLPPDSGDACYALVLTGVVAPALRAFSPDVIVAQLGADSHRDDPLTHLDTTVAGQYSNTLALVALADELCAGRIVATGGGGYDTFSAVPRAWACSLAALLGVEPPSAASPRRGATLARDASGGVVTPPLETFDENSPEAPPDARARALAGTAGVVERLRATPPAASPADLTQALDPVVGGVESRTLAALLGSEDQKPRQLGAPQRDERRVVDPHDQHHEELEGAEHVEALRCVLR